MSAREELEKVATCQRNLPTVRAETVERAHLDGMTWREIAEILGVTEHGLYKDQREWRAKQ